MVVLDPRSKAFRKSTWFDWCWRKAGYEGMRMGGRMGSDRITQRGMKIIAIDKENNTVAIEGSIADDAEH